jgi:hypothetical protein
MVGVVVIRTVLKKQQIIVVSPGPTHLGTHAVQLRIDLGPRSHRRGEHKVIVVHRRLEQAALLYAEGVVIRGVDCARCGGE